VKVFRKEVLEMWAYLVVLEEAINRIALVNVRIVEYNIALREIADIQADLVQPNFKVSLKELINICVFFFL
jgi:hypothetical protein